MFAQQFMLADAYHATVLYECMCHEPSPEAQDMAAEFFWSSPEVELVAIGRVGEDADVDSFERLAPHLDAWRELCGDAHTAEIVRLVGGVGFDANTSLTTTSWRGYDQGKFWVPRCLMSRHSDQCWVLTLCTMISPEMSSTQLDAHLRQQANLACAWLDASHAADVSRETSALTFAIEEPERAAWGELVTRTASHLSLHETLDKVVLARRLEVDFGRRIRPSTIVERLCTQHPSCTTFLVRPSATIGPQGAFPPRFVGASPECLVRMHEGHLYVDALAGSAPLDTADDTLLQSAKDRQEHRLVVDDIIASLTPFASVSADQLVVDTLSHIKHLRTPIRGKVHRGAGLTALAGALHPTPAVCGKPREEAMAYLRENEYGHFLDRGWYTGVVGWLGLDARDGAFYVALRCALLDWQHATLFVGAGIMPDSQAELELAETRNKANAVLLALESIGQEVNA